MGNKIGIRDNYRSEIDGLRAFAVVAVIINHFNKDVLPSGYLGVDIFFVISGYVITSSLNARKSKNFWDFISGFYERRIKRLFPALCVFVLITSILICLFNFYPIWSLRTGIASLFGVSNLYLLKHAIKYFASTTDLNVFTHTWSLGVEEQFYIIFPILTWLTGFSRQTSKGDRNLILLVLFLVVSSLISFIFLYPINQPAAYFLMPTRFWEMATGCLLFLGYKKNFLIINRLENTSPIFVLAAIIGVMFLPISSAIPATILIVILSSLLILNIREEKLLFKFFTNKNITYLGLISYSLYLWHWGVLSISRWTIGIHWWSIPFQILIIYFLAESSYKYIENPLRNNVWSITRMKTIMKGIFVLLIAASTLFALGKPSKNKLYLGDSNKLKYRENYFQKIPISDNCHNMSFETVYDHNKVLNQCLAKGKDKKQTLFFIGDSHNRAFSAGAEYIAEKTNSNLFAFSNVGIPFPSIQYFTVNSRESHLKSFEIFSSFEKKILLNIKKDDVFFIVIRYPYHFGKDWYEYPVSEFRFFDENNNVIKRNSKKEHFKEWLYALEEFTKTLSKKGAKLVISTPTPEFPLAVLKQCKGQNDQWFNKFSRVSCTIPTELFISEGGKYSDIINELKKVSSRQNNLYLFNAFDVICPDNICKYNFDDKKLYVDNDHLSDFAAKKILAPKMLEFLKEKKIISF